MNQYVPDWSGGMGDAFAAFNGGGDDDGLMELLWCNGHVVMQSQAPRKPARPDKAAAAVQDDEAAAWFQYPAKDALERDLFTELLREAQAAGGGRACKEEEAGCAGEAAASRSGGLMPPPREKACQGDLGDVAAAGECAATVAEAGESSMLTVGSSFCGSNHVQTPRARATCDGAPPGKAGGRAGDAATVTSSSMRSRSCTTRTGQTGATAHRSGKRRPSDATATEDAEFESADATCEPAQKLTTAKRRRAAEVHNLSERRRRDRINEKMKTLQELIPHCNKTDKASMLDEAIEYLKSLQLQLQMMWMGGGGGAGDVPGGGAPVHAADGGLSSRGVHAQDAVHGAAGRAEPAGVRHLRALPRRRPPAAASAPHALPAGNGLLPAAAEPGAATATTTGLAGPQPAGGDCTDVASRRHPAQKTRCNIAKRKKKSNTVFKGV